MNLYVLGVLVYAILTLIGFGLSMLISMLKCSKSSITVSITEGAVWATLPSFLFMLTKWSSYFLSIFAVPIQGFSSSLTPESAQMIAIGYVMMLGSWVMTTRMIHTTEIAVCKPSSAELAKFRDDLEKELKEKEEEKPTH